MRGVLEGFATSWSLFRVEQYAFRVSIGDMGRGSS